MTLRTNAAAAALASTAVIGSVGAAAAASPSADLSIHIQHHAGAIYRYDTNPDGGGPYAPAVRVSAVVRDCPVGDYLMSATLRQGGRTFAWADGGALGAGEVLCAGAPGTVAPRTAIGMSFYGSGLHPGRAVATFSVQPCCGDGVSASSTSSVWIPRTR